MTDASKDFPHHPAAFINAIREDGTKDEACEWLQKIWNERCSIAAERDALRAEVERRERIEQAIWLHVGEYLAGQTHASVSKEARRGIERAINAAFRAIVEANHD